ncbi:hypothetical protein GCM10009119_09690 [Algoriphagus jejuensis]|uniref:Uncharacterized protein n=1 Tax=Algoriphagus jejuensis TaxID=419934 RepID=A0ABP3YBN8_9BACT
MRKTHLLILFTLFNLLTISATTWAQEVPTPELFLTPIFQVNYGDATADKPQSKSWTINQEQWLIVADEDGPKLWKKEGQRWTSQREVNRAWENLPSKADVLNKGDEVHVVLVEACDLNVVKMVYSPGTKQYKHQWNAILPVPAECHSIETATLTQDSNNSYWVAADMNEKIMVWYSADGEDWSEPFPLADDINPDDISLIVSLEDQISVIWSNQDTQSINERIHYDEDAPQVWSELRVVQQGDSNADDHLNATVFENGEMVLVTKNSVDQIGSPQFVLRIRDRLGEWTNIPFENLTAEHSPSRPIINHVESGQIFEIHAVKNRVTNRYHISVNEVKKKNGGWEFKELVQLKTEINGKNGDATSSKASFKPEEAKLIFFSDELGNVYSFDIDHIIKK